MNPFPSQLTYSKTKRDFSLLSNDGAIKVSAEAAGDVSLRAGVARRGEELRRGAELDELTREQEGGEVADARGLLHVVGHGHDGAKILQLDEQLFDLGGADGLERRPWFVEKKHFGLDGESAGD